MVLGAGIQGVCAALALAQRGRRVVVVDAAEDCMLRASLRNEGKIHLGFVYANDPTGHTPALMLEAALRFGDLIDHWCGRTLDWPALRSRPFTYLVLDDSMVPAAGIEAAYDDLRVKLEAQPSSCYLGAPIDRLFSEVPRGRLGPAIDPDRVAAAFSTAEAALDVVALRTEMRSTILAHPLIETRYEHTVQTATRTREGFEVSGARSDGSAWALRAPIVVNCLWDRRMSIDQHLGIAPDRPWVHRLKYRVLGRMPEPGARLPSLTMVLGRFGDIVVHPRAPTYLSWYPACLAGWDGNLTPPADWAGPCAGSPGDGAASLAAAAIDGLARIVPALRGFDVETVDAGVITAWGTTDIDDPTSVLHERSEIGVQAHDGWYTVDTGKLTTAPLFAARLAAHVGAVL